MVPRIRPFAGLLYDPLRAGPLERLTAPPYDVITDHERDQLGRLSPYNVVRLIRGVDLAGDDERSNRHTRAAATLAEWRSDGVLVPTAPAVFVYEFDFHLGGVRRAIRAVVGEVALEPLGASVVPHERTMPGPLRDRTSLLRAVRANLSCLYLVYEPRGDMSAVRRLIEDAVMRAPVAQAFDEDGTRHRLWIRTDAGAACAALSRTTLMIADGHHRYAAALAFQAEMRQASGHGPWDAVMGLMVDAESEDPPVLPIHRVLKAGTPPAPDGRRVRDLEEVLRSVADDPPTVGVATIEDGDLVHRIVALDGGRPAVRALHHGPLEGVEHEGLAYVPDPVAAEQMVRSRTARSAFFLPPTRIAAVRSVLVSGATLPEKSTYFWPKPRTGMVIRPLEP
jgi:uncharacterized protein (DUF1015 family)